MRISDGSSDVCSSDLAARAGDAPEASATSRAARQGRFAGRRRARGARRMNVATLCVRRVSESDALNYHALRVQSLEGMVQPIEPQVREELETGAMGMARRLVRYGIEGTRVWGVFDDETYVGVLCRSRRHGERQSTGK